MTGFIPDAVNAKSLLCQSQDRLKAARALIKLGYFDDAINRAYYSAFNAVSLLFYSEGESFSKHSSLIGAFNKRFIHTGLFPKSVGPALSDMFRQRQQSDYEIGMHFDIQSAESAAGTAAMILEMVVNFINDHYPELLK